MNNHAPPDGSGQDSAVRQRSGEKPTITGVIRHRLIHPVKEGVSR